jgi:hypothetical protein
MTGHADWTETGQETMARKVRSSQLETRSARLRLAPAWKPYFVRLGRGLALGYRRTKTAGTWVVRVSNGAGSHWTKAIGTADDFEDSGASLDTLDFDAAQDRARAVARSGQPDDDGTVRKALDRYEADLRTRGADVANVVRVRNHLSDKLSDKNVGRLVVRDLRSWRDGLAKAASGLWPPASNSAASASSPTTSEPRQSSVALPAKRWPRLRRAMASIWR